MTAINTNVGALNAGLYALSANRAQEQAMERLSSGLRVNSAADDARACGCRKDGVSTPWINCQSEMQDGVGLIQTGGRCK